MAPWYKRLQVQFACAVSLLVALSLGATLLNTSKLVTEGLESERLEAARAAFHRLLDNRIEVATARLRLVVGSPVFLAHMSDPNLASDLPTVTVMTDDYRDQLGARCWRA